MQIRYKSLEHEITTDAPWVGARISAIGCKFKCKGCQNRDLKKSPNMTKDVLDIINEIKSNPFNQGIILGGLEFSEQPVELVELCKVASDNGLKVMIYTGCDIEQFQARIGQACADKVGIPPELKEEKDSLVWAYIGSQILDFYITDDYYIKCGKYDALKLEDDRVQFGVKLASSNQNIYKIARVK